MNTNKKHKSKNKSKPNPNTNTGEKVELTSDGEQKDVQVSEVVENVPKEESGKDIVSENVGTISDKGTEPKKPKRNKNKKKQEQEEAFLEKMEKQDEMEKGELFESKVDTETNDDFITPTARKKKNKQKKTDAQGDATDKVLIRQEATKQKQVEETEDKNKGQDIAISPVPEETKPEQESKSAKKKNKKKKNRNDSERSDKAEEVISCTAAFQKLLDVKTESPEISAKADDRNVEQPKPKDVIQVKVETQVKSDEDTQKTKKKNKKGKSVIQPEDNQQKPLEPEMVPDDAQTKVTIEPVESKKTESELICETTAVTKMPSPKPKAKIAKPVEKKNKNKMDEVELLSSTILSKVENEQQIKESPVSKSEPEKEIDSCKENKDALRDVPEPMKKESKSTICKTIENIQEKEVQLSEGDQSSLQSNVTLSQILDKKTEEYILKTKDIIEPLTDEVKEAEIVNIPVEEPKSKMWKNNKKNKNRTDAQSHEISSPVVLPEFLEETTDKSLQEKQDVTKHVQPEAIPLKEKPQQEFESLDKSSKSTETEIIMQQTIKDELTAVLSLKTEETLQISPSSNRRKKSPMKRDNKEIKSQGEENLKPDFVMKSRDDQKEETNVQLIDLMAQEIKQQSTRDELTAVSSLKTEETLQISPSNNRRKKSPMKRDNKDLKSQGEENLKPDIIMKSKDDQKEDTSVQLIDLIAQEVKTPKLECQLQVKENVTEIHTVTETCKIIKDSLERTSSHEDLQVPVHKNKKRKKSPKPPETPTQNVPFDTMEISHQQAPKEVKPSEKKQAIVLPFREAENSQLSEKVPDSILYPRSLSQSIVDPNNNASIREIKTPEHCSIGLFEVPHTAIIEGSGASPTTTEQKLPNIQTPLITEVITEEKEKTDLKSKVLEVNKDMEVLRLSIERSLAELTCLDEKELELEKPKEDEKKKIQDFALKSNKESEKSNETPQAIDDIAIPTITTNIETIMQDDVSTNPPICPARQDKGKGKSKKKNKHENHQTTSSQTTQQSGSNQASSGTTTESKPSQSEKKDAEKSEKKSDTQQEKGKQSDGSEKRHSEDSKKDSSCQHDNLNFNKTVDTEPIYSTVNKVLKSQKGISSQTVSNEQCASDNTKNANHGEFEPIENFEDAMTSSMDDVNKSFEMIATEGTILEEQNNPAISITAPEEDTQKKDDKDKINPVSQPKNLLGHIDIPVPSNRTDYKKEKNKTPNARQAKVKIKDAVENEPAKTKESRESQTESKRKLLKKDTTIEESVPCLTNENEEFVYKYSFRKVFLPNVCHICKKELKTMRVPCNFCSLIFYCSDKHKDEGWQQHQGLCFAVSTVAHQKGQKHIYADAKNITGHEYRLYRMQTILACEKVLKRKLVAWEQETLLYPRICADPSCREFRQNKLKDCDGCGQVFFCVDFPEHLPKTHQRWCKSYNLYHKLVHHQQTQGRLAPKLPTKVLTQPTLLPDKINMMLATLYEEKIDMNEIQYAALTQIATAPLTTAYSYQLYSRGNPNVTNKSTFTIHIVGAELQYEADALNKWETLFLHLKPDVMQLNVVMICALNPSDLPLDLLGKVKLCANCRLHSRRLVFHFQDKKSYYEYWDSNDFLKPDIVCSFNPSIQRCTVYNGKDQWPLTITTIFKQKCPFLITSYTMNELNRDLNRIKECSTTEFRVLSEAKFNPFASVRPDRNFITDDESPLLFKNFCFAVLCAA